jgi:hypothetical protein
MKRAHGGGVGAILPSAGGENLPAAQQERERDKKPLPQKGHAPESRRRGAATKAGNAEPSG